MLTGAPSRSHAETGSVRLKITKVGFIVGVGGGSGVLHFKGKNYRLGIGGVSAGTIGAAGADLVGTASNLRTAADIAGTYSAVSAGVAVAGGAKAATLRNRTEWFCNCRDARSDLRLPSAWGDDIFAVARSRADVR
jgi:hypothetical protein